MLPAEAEAEAAVAAAAAAEASAAAEAEARGRRRGEQDGGGGGGLAGRAGKVRPESADGACVARVLQWPPSPGVLGHLHDHPPRVPPGAHGGACALRRGGALLEARLNLTGLRVEVKPACSAGQAARGRTAAPRGARVTFTLGRGGQASSGCGCAAATASCSPRRTR